MRASAVRTAEGPGETTSGTMSPTLGVSIAFARLPLAVKPGDTVEVDIRGKWVPATVAKLPSCVTAKPSNTRKLQACARPVPRARRAYLFNTYHRISPGAPMSLPTDRKYTSHEWVKAEGDVFVVGITDNAQDQLGDLVFVGDVNVGATLKAGETAGVVESVKAASDIYARSMAKSSRSTRRSKPIPT